jgi:acyl-CoA synthetase (NDP forming)
VEIQNPVDLTGPGFLPQNCARVLETLLDEDFDAYLLVWNYNPHIRVPTAEIECLSAGHPGKTIVVVLLANPTEAAPYLERLNSRGVCTYLTPEDGATALNALPFRHQFLQREGVQ